MDDLTAALSASFAVSKEPNSTSAPHPRLAQYKSKYSVLEQSERRRRFLDLQKRYIQYLTLEFLIKEATVVDVMEPTSYFNVKDNYFFPP